MAHYEVLQILFTSSIASSGSPKNKRDVGSGSPLPFSSCSHLQRFHAVVPTPARRDQRRCVSNPGRGKDTSHHIVIKIPSVWPVTRVKKSTHPPRKMISPVTISKVEEDQDSPAAEVEREAGLEVKFREIWSPQVSCAPLGKSLSHFVSLCPKSPFVKRR